MNTFYLLPCPCGRKIPVQLPQAGEIVTCACGGSLEVPSLLGLKALERSDVPAESKTPKTAWGTGHRLIFSGAIIILFAIGMGAWLFWFPPIDPYANFTPDQMRQAVETLTPAKTWLFWQMLESKGLDRRKRGPEIEFADNQAKHQFKWGLLALVAGTGLAVVAAGIIIVHKGGRRKGEG